MPESSTDPIAARVRAELARVNKSGRQLAAELDWPYPQLWRRLTGAVPFGAAEIARIAKHLELPVELLIPAEAA